MLSEQQTSFTTIEKHPRALKDLELRKYQSDLALDRSETNIRGLEHTPTGEQGTFSVSCDFFSAC